MTPPVKVGAAPGTPPREPETVPDGERPTPPEGTGPSEKARDPRGTVRRVLGLLRPQRGRVAVLLGLGIVGVTLNALGPKLLGDATDLVFAGVVGKQVSTGESKAAVVERLRAEGHDSLANVFSTVDVVPGRGIDFDGVGRLLLIVLALYAAASLFTLLQGWLATAVVQRVVFDLRERVEAKLARLPLSYFDRNPPGEVLSRVTNDVDNLQQTLQQSLSQLITAVFSTLSMLVLMFVISPLLALIMLIGVPVSALLATLIVKRAQPQFAAQWAATGTLNAHVEEMYSGHSLVKGFGRRELAERAFDEHNEAMYRAGAKAQSVSGTIEPSMMFVANLSYIVVAVVGALRVVSGSLSIGEVQAFILYSGGFSRPIVEAASVAGRLQSGAASAERVFALLDADEQGPDPRRPVRPERVEGHVEFERVSFAYTPGSPLIDDLSLTVRPGQTVAIVGPTGAGKTTLGNLLMRFYELDGGRILLDGTDIAGMTREELRANIGLVLQDAWLFGGTIAENIAYGRPDATREEIVAAARATCVDRFVRTLPDAYDTVLDDETSSVSAGEKQLITVARAFLTGPAILVLDEATSSVDTRTEVLIQRALNSLRAGRTSFVIAHRLSTIRDADVIVVMEAGRIIERGTHEELIQNAGTYARMYASRTLVPGQEPGEREEPAGQA
ncbi:ABC transporter ATP-binding protein [Streptomyces syringium]|uniref:ABC transporter ATP-binding protein n=1 Tax=Streptomyces syringium TaxID=76729 RepID=UPI0033A5656F